MSKKIKEEYLNEVSGGKGVTYYGEIRADGYCYANGNKSKYKLNDTIYYGSLRWNKFDTYTVKDIKCDSDGFRYWIKKQNGSLTEEHVLEDYCYGTDPTRR